MVGEVALPLEGLQYDHPSPRGAIENILDNDPFRFLENHMPIYYYNCHCKSLSVDNRKDIDGVEAYLRNF